MVKFRCQCGQKIGVPDSYAGKRVRCPRCTEPARVPAAAVPVGPAAPAPVAPPGVAPESVTPKALAPAAAEVAAAASPHEAASTNRFAAPVAPSVESEPVITGRVKQDFSAVFGGRPSTSPEDFFAAEPVAAPSHPPTVTVPADQSDPHSEARDRLSEQEQEQEPEAEQPSEQEQEPEAEQRPEPEQRSEWEQHSEPEEPSEPERPSPVEFQAAASDVIDVPPPRRAYGLNSADEVADLLRGFDAGGEPGGDEGLPGGGVATQRRVVAQPASLTIARAVAPAAILEAAHQRRFSALGAGAILLGLAAIAICWVPQIARYSLAVGAAGAVVAAFALVLTLLRRRTSLTLPIGGAVACAVAIALPVMASHRLLPAGIIPQPSPPPSVDITPGSGSRNLPSDGYVSALNPVQLGNLQVHVVSALIQQPVAYKGDWKDYRSLSTRRLHITVELRDMAPNGQIVYRSWGQPDKTLEPPILTDSAGNLLKLIDLGSFVPVGRCAVPTTLYPKQDAVSDVIIFERPTDSGDLLLQLPGKNAGMPGKTIKIRIPGQMIEQN